MVPPATTARMTYAHGQKFLVNTIVDDSDNAPLEVTLHWDAGLTK